MKEKKTNIAMMKTKQEKNFESDEERRNTKGERKHETARARENLN